MLGVFNKHEGIERVNQSGLDFSLPSSRLFTNNLRTRVLHQGVTLESKSGDEMRFCQPGPLSQALALRATSALGNLPITKFR